MLIMPSTPKIRVLWQNSSCNNFRILIKKKPCKIIRLWECYYLLDYCIDIYIIVPAMNISLK